MERQIIIVAGGKGLRMGGEIPKQFLPINGKPILMLTIERFYSFDTEMRIILVLPKDQHLYWKSLCEDYNFQIPHIVAQGGETRFHSVKNGLSFAHDDGIIAVHDGVRPFVSHEVIERCFTEAVPCQAVVPVLDMVDSVRFVDGSKSVTVDRNAYKSVQTPQVFSTTLLKNAYNQEFSSLFTDDASVVESFGVSVTLVPGNRENIKITTPFDIQIANALTNV